MLFKINDLKKLESLIVKGFLGASALPLADTLGEAEVKNRPSAVCVMPRKSGVKLLARS
jgi:hypothetical protein